MKYLKLFEDHNDFYTQIGKEEFDNMVDWNKCEIDYKYHSNILELINNNNNNINFWKYAIQIIGNSKNHIGLTSWKIYQLPDEWFYIECREGIDCNYYKCDQWDGIVKYLKDNEVIK